MRIASSVAVALLVVVASGCRDDDPAEAGASGGSGCAPAAFSNPSDTSQRGPWPVGVVTATVAGMTVEIWYPAASMAAPPEPRVYDLRAWLPASEQGKIPDADAPLQRCDCHADLPLDTTRGPYPAVLFAHGTGGYRAQSLELMTHWASRGFVVLAADHPGLYLRDVLGLACGQGNTPPDVEQDLVDLAAALAAPSDPLAFLAGHVDASRLAMSGHSAGGRAIAQLGDAAEVLIPMASGGVVAGARLRSTLILGALEDRTVEYGEQIGGYESSPAPKRLVGLSPAGHLTFSSLCAVANAAGQDLPAIGLEHDVCGLELAGSFFDCDPAYLAPQRGWEITRDTTSAVLEAALHGSDRAANLSSLRERYPEVAELREEL